MTARPIRIQLSRRKGWRMPENTVKVDRSTPLGNPFVVGVNGTRARCVELFIHLLDGMILMTGSPSPVEQSAYLARVTAARDGGTYRGKNLACWCGLPAPGEPDLCHAAPLLEVFNR